MSAPVTAIEKCWLLDCVRRADAGYALRETEVDLVREILARREDDPQPRSMTAHKSPPQASRARARRSGRG